MNDMFLFWKKVEMPSFEYQYDPSKQQLILAFYHVYLHLILHIGYQDLGLRNIITFTYN